MNFVLVPQIVYSLDKETKVVLNDTNKKDEGVTRFFEELKRMMSSN